MPGHQSHYSDSSVGLPGLPSPYDTQVGHDYGHPSETPAPAPSLHTPQRQKHEPDKGEPSVTLKGVPGPHSDHGPQLPLKAVHTSWHYPHHSSPPTGFEAAAASKLLHERQSVKQH
ncbi:hypothetical protein TTRE_0000887701 [Trichuris trichiura]|uniref:Uncharacterized protein n=1 Tax=Trichuris trichiura TaxID=36087 RepID=A0A077ZJA0_TRITR|nr:hypothetical protein TTRE_0000887701 [Trichuris trichiura]